MGEWRYGFARSGFARWLEESEQLHGLYALLTGKALPIPTE